MANQEKDAAQFEKAGELLSRAYHEENIQNELQAIPEQERRDILDKMQQIDRGMHALPATSGQHFPALEIVDQGASYIGIKGDKLREANSLHLIQSVEDQAIKKAQVSGNDGQPGTKWLAETIAPKH